MQDKKDNTENEVGIIILAAGNSARLGQPKQLLAYNNTTLLKNTIEAATAVPNALVIVVTGSNHDLIQDVVTASSVTINFNPDWEFGMSSSIVSGLKELSALVPDIENCIFAVCDQPYITDTVFNQLIAENKNSSKGIIACSYTDTLGSPVLFNKKYFEDLLELKGHEGAKTIIGKHSDDVASIPFEKGYIDIDTAEDYDDLIS